MESTAPVAVIGAGHNGLVAALTLAEAGVPVTVFEHAPRPGGGLSSFESPDRYLHDYCAGFFPVTRASPAMRELRLEDEGVEWITPDLVMAHPFADGQAIALHRDLRATSDSLNAVAPGAGDAWTALMERVLPHQEQLTRAIFSRLPPVLAALRLLAALRTEATELGRRSIGSVAVFGTDLFANDRATAWLAGSAMHSGLEPRAAASGAFGFLLQLLGHGPGWPLARGGAGTIADALLRRLERTGGEVRCEAHVERVLVRGGRAAGVVLASGEELPARGVVASITARPLAQMLPPDALPERLFRRLKRWRYGTGVYKLDYALSAPVPWTSEVCRRAGVVHAGGDLDELSRGSEDAQRDEIPDAPPLVVGQQSLFDDTRAPEGGHTLYVYAHMPIGQEAKPEIRERMQAQVERFAPGFGELVIARNERSPAELERHNPSMVGGDLAGGSMEIDQELVFRPSPELMRYRTPLRGLYIGSASVHPGDAIHGVCGREAAKALLEDRSPLRFWR